MSLNTSKLIFPCNNQSDWKIFSITELRKISQSKIDIDSGELKLTIKDLIYLNSLCNSLGHKLNSVTSNSAETVVSARSLSITSELSLDNSEDNSSQLKVFNKKKQNEDDILFHVGTIRAGNHLQSEGDLLVLGDVNPGAIVSAKGHVMIWGKLLGIAHAGKSGNRDAKVFALSLRPVQLRIADIIAKGPKEIQKPGLAEQAEISHGFIVINPLSV